MKVLAGFPLQHISTLFASYLLHSLGGEPWFLASSLASLTERPKVWLEMEWAW
jgi:hypothetical protein